MTTKKKTAGPKRKAAPKKKKATKVPDMGWKLTGKAGIPGLEHLSGSLDERPENKAREIAFNAAMRILATGTGLITVEHVLASAKKIEKYLIE